MQTKLQSFIEACVNVAIGYFVAILGQLLVFPHYGIQISIRANLEIGVLFTLISIARSYLVRRLFNKLHEVQG